MSVVVLAVALGLAQPGGAAGSRTIVSCGEAVSTSIVLANSLFDCPFDGLVVRSNNITIDLGGNRIDGNEADDNSNSVESGVKISNRTGVHVINGYVSGFEVGVSISGSGGNRVEGVKAFGNSSAGVSLDSSSSNALTGNTTSANDEDGILLNNSGGNTLKGNTASNNPSEGIVLENSDTNTLTANIGSGNGVEAIHVDSSDGNNLKGNTASGNIKWGIVVASSQNNVVKGNIASGNGADGIKVVGAFPVSSNVVQGNTASGNAQLGIRLTDANNNNVQGNNASGNGEGGIYVESSDGVTVTGNVVNQNGFINGLSDGNGLGIEIAANVTNLTASKNKAADNDDPAQCSPAANCV